MESAGPVSAKVGLAAGDVERLGNLVGENALAAHSRAETGIVEFVAANGADAVQYFVLFSGDVACQPLFKNRRDGGGQAQDFGVGPAGAGGFGGGQNRRDFVVV